jgi:hypothetical protein
MIGITVSTNYADILAIVLPQNIKFFTEWIIVTSADDAATIKLITESGFKKIYRRKLKLSNAKGVA